MKTAIGFVCLFILTGCLLKQTDPATTIPSKGFLLGSVVLEDLIASNQGEISMVNAEFAIKPPENKTNQKPVDKNGGVITSAATLGTHRHKVADALMATSNRGPICRKQTVDLAAPADSTTSGRKLERVNVGTLGIGPVLQEAFEIFQVSETNRYQAILKPATPAGAYAIVSEGNETADSFSEILTLPEQVRHLRINGVDFGDVMLDFEPARNQELFWAEPAIANAANGIVFEITQKEGSLLRDVSCAILEQDIPAVEGFKTWTLDKAWFSEISKAEKVGFYFMRVHFRQTTTKRSQFQLQGSRTFYSNLDVR